MLDKLRNWLIGLSLLVVVGGLIFMFTDSDAGTGQTGILPPTDFGSIEHGPESGEPGYLLCSNSVCSRAIADGPALTLSASPSEVMAAVVAVSDSAVYIRTHELDIANLQFEFLERLPSETIPSVVAIKLEGTDLGQTQLNIYSFKPVGDSDRQDHASRVSRWVEAINQQLGR